MNKKWIICLSAFIIIVGGVFILKSGVKKAVESSLQNQKPVGTETASQGHSQSNSQGNENPSATQKGSQASSETSAQVPNEGQKPVAKKAAPENNCFAFEYRHTQDAKNRDIEDFLDDTNAFPILHPNANLKSICVKVNHKPVAFKLSKNHSQREVWIGSVVGPESVIRVSYCVGKVPCKESCAIKTNRFMDDLMSDAGEGDFKDSWDESPANAAQKKELQGKVKELRSVASENQDLNQRSVVRTWETIEKQEWVCKK